MADTPQQTVRELQELVVAYAKQETIDPLKGMARYVGFGLAGAVLMGCGVSFLALGALRAMQSNRGWAVNGNWSWVPYLVVVLALGLTASGVWLTKARMTRQPRNTGQSDRSSRP